MAGNPLLQPPADLSAPAQERYFIAHRLHDLADDDRAVLLAGLASSDHADRCQQALSALIARHGAAAPRQREWRRLLGEMGAALRHSIATWEHIRHCPRRQEVSQ